MTSLIVPRPIGWISTWGEDGTANLAPFSYFAALSVAPLLLGVSIGHLRHGLKDTLVNIRRSKAFCVNVVTAPYLEVMNATSEDVASEIDEFELAGLERASSQRVHAPYVGDCPAVLECEVRQEVDLGGAPNTLIIAEVVSVQLAGDLPFEEGTMLVVPEELRPVGRLGGSAYATPGEVVRIPRPHPPAL